MDWHDIRDPNDPELDRLADRYQLHPLHVEDCRHRSQSAKIEETQHYLFIVLKPVERNEDGTLQIDDLDLILGRDFLITVQESPGGNVRRILDQARTAWHGVHADQLFYSIMDGVVDSYLPTLDRFDDVIDALEDEVLENPSPSVLARIFRTKRGLIELRRVLGNMRDLAGHLQRTNSELMRQEMWPFLRDIYDHLARNLDMVEMQRDLLTGALDIYLSSVANRTNRIMKILTVLGTVALPAIVISSFYGMNLKNLPWLESPYAPVIVTALMAGSTALLVLLLRILRWF